MKITKELYINTALAAFWVGAGVLLASNQPTSRAALAAAAAAAVRFFVGAMLLNSKKIPSAVVDE